MTPPPPRPFASGRARLRQAPPTRYRVVERGRRLEVIDTWASERPSAATRTSSAPVARLPGGVERTRFDGGGRLTTHPLYDEKAPRTITLDGGSAAMVRYAAIGATVAVAAFVALAVWQPAVLIVLVALAQKNARNRVRGATTRWLDRVEREAS